MNGPKFDAEFLDGLEQLIRWRRDVRRFRTDPVPNELFQAVLALAQLSPSVGNSQPWRIVHVASTAKANFEQCNAVALAAQQPSRASDYARLKLQGLDRAPLQLAIFCDRATAQGHGLGSMTMPEALDYSVVTMISILWFAARARGLGLGWVSILDANGIASDLGTPNSYRFIAYLCIGWPEEEHEIPELERSGWQARTDLGRYVVHV